jgi:hypothetical protein
MFPLLNCKCYVGGPGCNGNFRVSKTLKLMQVSELQGYKLSEIGVLKIMKFKKWLSNETMEVSRCDGRGALE